MKLFRLLVVSLTLAACNGGDDPPPADTSGGGDPCTNADYDPCTSNDQCASNNCHLFMQSGFQICAPACQNQDDNTCPLDSSGAHGDCNMQGICKPAAANDCTR